MRVVLILLRGAIALLSNINLKTAKSIIITLFNLLTYCHYVWDSVLLIYI